MRPDGHLVYRRRLLFGIALTLLLSNVAFCESENTKNVKIGVLAKRGAKHALAKWSPTADYLTKNIEGYTFKIVPLEFEEIYSAAESRRVEFILTNSSFYVGLEMLHGMNRIVTLKNLGFQKAYTVFGGVIFCKASRKNIIELDDLKDKSFMAVQKKSLGGWQMAWFELLEEGIDPYKDFSEIKFGSTHDAVVYAVAEGEADAGTVRTDTLERMQDEGKIDLTDFRILNQHKRRIDFPYVHSTRLYPEWPLAKARHTSDELAEKVASALLKMSPDSDAAKAAKCAGWTIPHNYQAVHDCLKSLRLGPYKDYGTVTLVEVFIKYWIFMLLIMFGVTLLCAFTLYVVRLNQRLNQAQIELEKHRDSLEHLVDERTAELSLERDKLKTILETMDDGVYIVNQNYDVEYLNSATMAQFKPLEGHKCYSYFHGINEVCPWCKNPEVLAGKTVRWEFVQPNTGKAYDIIETPLNNVDGSVSKLAIIRDITERKHAEQEREKLLRNLNAKNKELQSIVYISSHDLKTPLINIKGFSHLLNEHCQQMAELVSKGNFSDDNKQKIDLLLRENVPEDLDFVSSSADRMTELIEGLLRVSRIGVSEIRNKEIDMNKMISEIFDIVKYPIDTAQIEIAVDRIPNCTSDEDMLKQLFSNLISNALKYLDPDRKGKMHISGRVEGSNCIYCVEDNGIGIAAEHQSKIFELYHRLNPEDSVGGEGLGLTIVSRILDKLNGHIHVESELGKGSKFFVSLPGSADRTSSDILFTGKTL